MTPSDDQAIDLLWGTTPTVEGLSHCFLRGHKMGAPKGEGGFNPIEGVIEVESAGEYFLAFRDYGTKTDATYLTDLIVSKENTKTPAPCPLLTAVADRDGSLHATVTLQAPSVDITGRPLEGTLNLTLLRDSLPDVELRGVEPGRQFTFDNVPTQDGAYTFQAYAANQWGESKWVSCMAYIGINVPDRPEVTETRYTGNTRDVRLSWKQVDRDIEGQYLDPKNVTYTVIDHSGTVLASAISDTTIMVTVPDKEVYGFWQWKVTATTRKGTSEAGISDILPYGKAISEPYVEHFSPAGTVYPLQMQVFHGGVMGSWYFAEGGAFYTDGTLHSMPGDDGLAFIQSFLETPQPVLMTSLYDVASFSKPQFTVNVLNAGITAHPLSRCLIYANVAGEHRLLKDVRVTDLEQGWNPVTVDLSDLRGQRFFIELTSINPIIVDDYGMGSVNLYPLFIDNLELSEAPTGQEPQAPVVKGKAFVDGRSSAHFAIEVPSKTAAGASLSGPLEMDIWHNGLYLERRGGLNPGDSIVIDLKADSLLNTYQGYAARCRANGLSGAEGGASLFLGSGVPAPPENVRITETSEGVARLTWDLVTISQYGDPLPADDPVTYTITKLIFTAGSGLKDCVWEGQMATTGQQNAIPLKVKAVNAAGSSELVDAPVIPIGTPYEAPFKESWKDAKTAQTWIVNEHTNQSDATAADDTKYTDVKSQDGDNGFMVLNYPLTLTSGKIKVAPQSCLEYWLYCPSYESHNAVRVTAVCDTTRTLLRQDVLSDLGNGGWTRVRIPMTSFADKTLYLEFEHSSQDYNRTALDNVSFTALPANNLTAGMPKVYGDVYGGRNITITAPVVNNGAGTAQRYDVSLLEGGNVVTTLEGSPLSSGADTSFTFTAYVPAMATSLSYQLRIAWANDQDTTDNVSPACRLTVQPSQLPAITINGQATADGNIISWEAPSMDCQRVTETFENSAAWNDCPQTWRVYDGDGLPVGGALGNYYPGWLFGVNKGTWKVMYNPDFNPPSGSQVMASMFAQNGANDDWLITPPLSGRAQRVSFKAMPAFGPRHYHDFKVMYSPSGNHPDDFVELSEGYDTTNDDWQTFNYDLPEGARYMAIRNVNRAMFMLIVDDVSYEAGAPCQLVGYDLYRGNTLLASLDADVTSFIDTDVANKRRAYRVAPRYDLGTGPLSNEVVLINTGLETLKGDAMPVSNDVYDTLGRIVLRNAVPDQLQGLQPGIYIYRGNKICVGR